MAEFNVIGTGVYDNVEQQIDPTHRAARVSLRPPEVGVYGSYRKALLSGVIAAGIATNSPVWEMRWGQSSVVAVVRKLKVQAVASATAFAATAADSSFSLFRAGSFTAVDGTGATFAAWTAIQKGANTATRMAESQFASDSSTNRINQGGIAISNTAAMSGGTKTLASDPVAVVINRILASAAAETAITPDPWVYLIDPAEGPGTNPVELSTNEGLVLRADAITATGTWRLAVEVEWDEVDPGKYYG